MSELHDKARALLALRQGTTMGPWLAFDAEDGVTIVGASDGSIGVPVVADVPPRTRHGSHEANSGFIAAAHDMADTIRDLLAENEYLRKINSDFVRQWNSRVIACARDYDRAIAAEAKLRALCEQEPLAWQSKAHPRFFLPHEGTSPEHWTPLIPRPSMD